MIRATLTFILLSFSILSCKDKNQDDIIPYVSFSGEIYLSDPQYISKNPFIAKKDNLGRTLGNNGVIIYRMSESEYYAYDLMCTYEKSYSCLVTNTDGAITGCSCCTSQYNLVTGNGDVVIGPSTYQLKRYNTAVNSQTLRIWSN